MEIIKLPCRQNNYLTQEAFKYLNGLLSYKVIAFIFISSHGLQVYSLYIHN